jgi:transposase
LNNGILETVGEGKTVIMDRASFHVKTKLEEICKEREVFLLYPPPHSPDFNPIEKHERNEKRFTKRRQKTKKNLISLNTHNS